MHIELEVPDVGVDFRPVIERLARGRTTPAASDKAEFLSLRDAALLMKMSPRQFQRTFVQAFGIPFKFARTYFAMMSAAQMLKSPGRPRVKEVWLALGYSGPIAFGRAFRRIWHIAPGEYGRNHTQHLPPH